MSDHVPENAPELAALRRALDDNDNPWVAGETPLARMSDQDRKARLGVPLPDATELALMDQRAASVRSSLRAGVSAGVGADGASLPAAFDLRNVGGQDFLGPVRNQGGCGSCVAFGAIATLEGTARFTRGTPTLDVDLSEAHLFYGWGASVGRNCDNGWLPKPALDFCTSKGVTYEALWPYSSGNTNGGSLPANWESIRAKSAGVLDHTSKLDAIKQHVSTIGPVTGCFVVYDDFFSYRNGVYRHVSGAQAGGHCVAIVGYDDAQQAWIIRNSWGPGWGMDGYGLIAYGECYIDTWSNIAVTGVALRNWTGARTVRGLYSSGHDNNGWVYVSDTGWLHVGGAGVSHLAMFEDLIGAKDRAAYVNAYSDDGNITQVYSY